MVLLSVEQKLFTAKERKLYETTKFKLYFPRCIMPTYYTPIYARFQRGYPTPLPLDKQLKYTKIIFHTTYVGDFVEHIESGGTGVYRYTRDYTDEYIEKIGCGHINTYLQ